MVIIVVSNLAFTKPPDYLTESELISKLEKYGIGTDASMATHINNICERNYVEVKAARKLVPTELGIALVSGYNAVDHELVAADLRSKIEGSCNKIANGEMTFEDVVKESSDLFKAKFIEFKKNIGKMDVFFMKSFTSFEQAVNKDAKVFSKCGNCGRYMDLISRFSKLQCTTCDVTYQLPRSSNYIIQGQFVCPLDNFQIISYTREGIYKEFIH